MTIEINRIALAALLALMTLAAIWLLLFALGPDWSIYTPASCTATRCFCEMPRQGSLIVQPANSWSNIGYIFVGWIIIIFSQASNWTSGFHRNAAAWFGLTAIVVGSGSVLLHATLTLWGQFFDVMGMYLVSGFMLVSAIAKWKNASVRASMVLYIAMVGGLVLVLYFVPEVRRSLFGVVLFVAITIELIYARPRRQNVRISFYVLGMAIQTLAFVIWNLDQHDVVCDRYSLLQGHAAWHLLGAISLWFSFLYYRSERPSEFHESNVFRS